MTMFELIKNHNAKLQTIWLEIGIDISEVPDTTI